jgi:hypothetical protein
MLQFASKWRVTPPTDGSLRTSAITSEAVDDIYSVIETMAAGAPQGEGWNVIEHYKGFFANAGGGYGGRSSSWDFAEYDLRQRMGEAASNAPKFIEAFHDGSQSARTRWTTILVPDCEFINAVLEKHDIGYVVDPPHLKLRQAASLVSVSPSSLLDTAHRELRDADSRSHQLLAEGRPREAVQNSLFLLESVTTAFNNIGVRGSYFTEIIKRLKIEKSGTILSNVLGWVTQLHGFLSAPKGGGVRHGIDLARDPIEHHEAELFCNLIHSYINYVLAEYDREQRRLRD